MRRIHFLLSIIFLTSTVSAQEGRTEAQLYLQAEKLQQDKKWNEALSLYKNLLKGDSSNVEYLWRTSFIYSKIGVDQKTEGLRQQWYRTAAYLGKKAITQHPQSANAHYAYAVALGRMNEFVSNKTKIEYAKLIKSETDITIKLDPKLAGAYHILGRWHRVIADFNFFERAMISALFGGMPGGSYDDSIKNFEKAILLEPLNGIHYYELAQSYLARDEANDKKSAKNWLTKALQISVKNADDAANKSKCEQLLKEIN